MQISETFSIKANHKICNKTKKARKLLIFGTLRLKVAHKETPVFVNFKGPKNQKVNDF